jgi:heme/copper-type cytochrome/quinol oxidase subunit 2
MRSSRRSVALASLALAVVTVFAGCGDEKTDKLKADDGPLQPTGNGITPVKLEAKKGHKVEITVTNTAKDKPHGFSIDAFKVAEVIEQGKTTKVEFKADKAGTYKVYCQLHDTHKPAELVVS